MAGCVVPWLAARRSPLDSAWDRGQPRADATRSAILPSAGCRSPSEMKMGMVSLPPVADFARFCEPVLSTGYGSLRKKPNGEMPGSIPSGVGVASRRRESGLANRSLAFVFNRNGHTRRVIVARACVRFLRPDKRPTTRGRPFRANIRICKDSEGMAPRCNGSPLLSPQLTAVGQTNWPGMP